MRVVVGALICLSSGAVSVKAQDAEPPYQRVFKIERSKNSKVVQYDVRVGRRIPGRTLRALTSGRTQTVRAVVGSWRATPPSRR